MLEKTKHPNGNGHGGRAAKPGAAEPAGSKSTMQAARAMIPSRVALPVEMRSKLAGVLQVALATSLDLHSQVKQAHWNVIGPHFIAYHELFDRIAADALAWTDLLAERCATLGGVPQGTVRQSSTLTQLPDYALGAADGPTHVEALTERLELYCARIRDAAAGMDGDELADPVTQDLMIQILRAAELDLWFLDKHTQRA